MMRRYIALLIALMGFLSNNAFGLSCGYVSEKDIVETYEHIFIVLVTDANYIPDGDDTPLHGKVVANFEVLSVIKGEPEKVPHIEAKVRGPNQNWPAQVLVGHRYVLVSHDGPARWSACSSHFRLPDTPYGKCKEYLLRKFTGEYLQEDRHCESEYLWRAFKEKNIKTESTRSDLAGLRREWVERFGILPE